MALNNISFVLGQGGLGRPLPGEDYISGLIFYTSGSLPIGFSSSSPVKQIFSVAGAEAAGITNDYSDAVAAQAIIHIGTAGNPGDFVMPDYTSSTGTLYNLGKYTVTSAESSATLQAAALAAVINSGTNTHGCTASASAANVTITLPVKEGIYPNTGMPVGLSTSGSAVVATLTQPSAATQGTASVLAVWHYHISEYFRLQPQGNLYVGVFAVPDGYTFTEINTLQSFANGKIRQVGIFKQSEAFNAGDLTAIDTQCKLQATAHKELIALYAADMAGITDLSTLADLSQYSANTVSAVIGQDGAAAGAQLFKATGKSVTTLGATLGAVSAAAVNESIAWVQKFNISNGTECDTPAFANGTLFNSTTVTDNLLTLLQNRRYIFLRRFTGVAGSYFNECSTATSPTSDYAYISDNRTIQKATRGVYAALIPALNSTVQLNADGTLSDVASAYFTALAEDPLHQMARDGEISAQQVVINASQNVLSTGLVVITISIVPTGTARNIQVNIGFNVSIN